MHVETRCAARCHSFENKVVAWVITVSVERWKEEEHSRKYDKFIVAESAYSDPAKRESNIVKLGSV